MKLPKNPGKVKGKAVPSMRRKHRNRWSDVERQGPDSKLRRAASTGADYGESGDLEKLFQLLELDK